MQGLDYQSAETLAEYILSEVLIVEPAGTDAVKRASASENRAEA
jgi:hypothetical protein